VVVDTGDQTRPRCPKEPPSIALVFWLNRVDRNSSSSAAARKTLKAKCK
jgi:hypothetical protein